MKHQNAFRPESLEAREFRVIPIPEASQEVRARFQDKEWRRIPITEKAGSEPKQLEVVPNRHQPGQAMAWPAYYKTVMEENENNERPRGFGELAQAIGGDVQVSPLVKVRPEIKTKLDTAQKLLDQNPDTAQLQLLVVDGYRRVDVQKRLFEAYYQYLNKQAKGLSRDELLDAARKMVSEPPADLDILKNSPPPHTTGGALDVILVYKDKIDSKSDYWLESAMVPLGAKFDEMMNPVYQDERSATTFYEQKLAKTGELDPDEQEALENRRVLYHAMTSVGITNYHNEFWHYDYGNQFHAAESGKDIAEYGFAGGVDGEKIVEDLVAERKAFEAYGASRGSEEAERVKHHFGL